MAKAEHACLLEMETEYVPEIKRNVQRWRVSCSCGWGETVKSRDMAREVYRSHRDGLPRPEVKEREVVASGARNEVIVSLVTEMGPMRSDEVRGALFSKGVSLTEPTVRKNLKEIVGLGLLSCKEMPSKRSKVVVLYFAPEVTFEAISAKVREFDRVPSGFRVGRSF